MPYSHVFTLSIEVHSKTQYLITPNYKTSSIHVVLYVFIQMNFRRYSVISIVITFIAISIMY